MEVGIPPLVAAERATVGVVDKVVKDIVLAESAVPAEFVAKAFT
jgi:hypothetical protein